MLRSARPDEHDVVMEILGDAAAWLNARGIRQWSSPPPRGLWSLVEREIRKQQVYLARSVKDGQAVGMVRFEWTTPRLWRGYSDDAGYVYSLAIRSRVAGFGIGALILEWAKEHIRSQGKQFIRLDCLATNLKIREYYEKLRFTFRGLATQEDYHAALYEMRL